MGRLLVSVMAGALVLGALRNLPARDGANFGSWIAGVVLALALAYVAGRMSVRKEAIATATARAEANALAAVQASTTSTASVVVNLDPALGARRAGEAAAAGVMPWIGGPSRSELVESETDFVDSVMSEFDSDSDHDTVQ